MAAVMRAMTIDEGAALFGVTADKVAVRAAPALTALAVEPLDAVGRDGLMLQALTRIAAADLKDAGEHRLDDWEHGWAENRDAFIASGYRLDELVPRYYKPDAPIRLLGRYCRTTPPDFVYRYTAAFRACLFPEYLSNLPAVYEIGCGTGHNLVHLARMRLTDRLYGLDWARPSQDIMALLARHHGLPIDGARFDFFNPPPDLRLETGAGVLTFGALEQVGARHSEYLEWLLERRPAIVLDVAGLEELYEEGNLFDVIALAYHRRRSYLSGYLTALRRLEREGAITILAVHRHRFGNQFDDPYSYVAWRPR